MTDDDLLPELAAAAVESLPGGAFLGVLFDRATRAVQVEWRRNLSTAISIATDVAGLSREDLDELLELEPQLVPLFVRVLYAAGMNGHDKTLKLLGGFLGQALADTSHIDDVSLMLSAVENMTEHHIKVLEIVESPVGAHKIAAETSGTHWTTGLLVQVSGMRRELTLVAAQGLMNAGFVSDEGIDGGGATFGDLETGGTILQITELGQTVLDVLRAVAND
jgi:hypothetical protein